MKRIYIVDDDQDQIDATQAILESKGYAVGAQLDGEDLVENIINFQADLVILDAMFPDDETAGFIMARTMRKSEKLQQLPVIMLSAVNSDGHFPGKFSNWDIDESYFPVTEFMEKPVNPDKLVEAIERLTA